jgi:hypothetical protein
MNTKYPVTDEVLKTDVNVYKLGHRHRLLFKLKQDCGRVKSMLNGVESGDGLTMEREDKSTACELCAVM